MSWIEEQTWFGLEDVAIEYNEFQENVRNKFLKNHIWTTKDGVEIHVSNMKTGHIRNCINRCQKLNWRTYALPILLKELKSRL